MSEGNHHKIFALSSMVWFSCLIVAGIAVNLLLTFKKKYCKEILHVFCWCASIISDNNSKPGCATPPSCSNSPLSQCSVNVDIIPQDQIDDESIWFTTPIPPLRNQAILATATISVSTTCYSSQYFLTVNSPMLNSKLTALEIKMCGKIMVITSYFKNKLQSLKNYHYASNWYAQ